MCHTLTLLSPKRSREIAEKTNRCKTERKSKTMDVILCQRTCGSPHTINIKEVFVKDNIMAKIGKFSKKYCLFLSEASNEEIVSVSKELMDGMMSVGSALTSLTPAQAVDSDRKSYAEGGYKFSLAQLEEANLVFFHRQLDALATELDRVRGAEALDFIALLVTDPLRGHSELLFRGSEQVRRALPWRVGAHGLFDLPGVLSRKKQLLYFFF